MTLTSPLPYAMLPFVELFLIAETLFFQVLHLDLPVKLLEDG